MVKKAVQPCIFASSGSDLAFFLFLTVFFFLFRNNFNQPKQIKQAHNKLGFGFRHPLPIQIHAKSIKS